MPLVETATQVAGVVILAALAVMVASWVVDGITIKLQLEGVVHCHLCDGDPGEGDEDERPVSPPERKADQPKAVCRAERLVN